MQKNPVMNTADALAGSQASAYITVGDRRLCAMNLTSFEANAEVKKAEVAVLGKAGRGSKPVGWSGTWKGTAHYNTSIVREMLLEYKRTGKLPVMTIQITNEDPAASVGRQSTILKDCTINGGTLAKFDTGSDTLTEDIEGTFDDFEVPEKFTLMAGM